MRNISLHSKCKKSFRCTEPLNCLVSTLFFLSSCELDLFCCWTRLVYQAWQWRQDCNFTTVSGTLIAVVFIFDVDNLLYQWPDKVYFALKCLNVRKWILFVLWRGDYTIFADGNLFIFVAFLLFSNSVLCVYYYDKVLNRN